MANTYTLGNYKSWVRTRINRPSFDTIALTQFANDANRDICNDRRWRFMESTFNGTIAVGVSSYQLPTNFQAAINLAINAPDANAKFLNFVPYEIYDQTYPDPTALTAAQPSIWTFYGNSLIVGPAAPDQIYTMQLRYLKTPTALTLDANTLDVPDDFSELVVLGMAYRALMSKDIYDQAQVMIQLWDEQMDKMSDRLQSRQFGEPIRMGVGRISGTGL